jgi:hypothetical protein
MKKLINEYMYWLGTVKISHILRLFKDRVIMKIFRLKRDGVIAGRGKNAYKELYDLFYSPNSIRVIKS